MNIFKKLAKEFVLKHDLRDYENKNIIKEIIKRNKESKILDAGCGSGLLLYKFYKEGFKNLHGIDLNPENVKIANRYDLFEIKLGNILKTEYEDNQFDIVICSHVLQVFDAEKAFNLFKEFGRILKPDGLLVIVTLNDFKRFFRHPENCRPYPPDSIFRLISNYTTKNSAPIKDLDKNFPNLKYLKLWKRYNPIINVESRDNSLINKIGMLLNTIQYVFKFVNPFSYNAYIIYLKKLKN
jgi:2-polyprenyl-3-methyl-5-hydroxy-6-metoxy-1,4-benzoquinol methylase